MRDHSGRMPRQSAQTREIQEYLEEVAAQVVGDTIDGHHGVNKSDCSQRALTRAVVEALGVADASISRLPDKTDKEKEDISIWVLKYVAVFTNILVAHGKEAFVNTYDTYLLNTGDEPMRSITNGALAKMKQSLGITSGQHSDRIVSERDSSSGEIKL